MNMIKKKHMRTNRILTIYSQLIRGAPVEKKELARSFNVNEKTIQRDLDDIRDYFYDNEVLRKIKPVSIIFSEYYFYLIAYFDDFDSPTIFRVDRIKEYRTIGEKFYISYSERFEDGEFRKGIQFMYPGRLMKIRFELIGEKLEFVLDRLPTSKNIEQTEDKAVIEAEVYGKGDHGIEIIGWLYQYYISEKKDEVFAGLRKNKKITKENIPAATQLFTPKWIVKYMVENSLGRLWLEKIVASGQWSVGSGAELIGYFIKGVTNKEQGQLKEDLEYLLEVFYDAKEYGSILDVKEIDFDALEDRIEEIRNNIPEDVFELQHKEVILEKIPPLIQQARIMSQKYDVVCTNPPYMSARASIGPKLAKYLDRHYILSKVVQSVTFKEFMQFLSVARGSKAELETQILICIRLKYLKQSQTKISLGLCQEVGKMLNSLIGRLSTAH
jgi:hypothetical protein